MTVVAHLSLTDSIQHTCAPGAPEADRSDRVFDLAINGTE